MLFLSASFSSIISAIFRTYGLIKVSPIVCSFFCFAILSSTTYEASTILRWLQQSPEASSLIFFKVLLCVQNIFVFFFAMWVDIMQMLFWFCCPHGIITEYIVTKYTLWSFFIINHDRCKTILQIRLITLLLFNTHLNNY